MTAKKVCKKTGKKSNKFQGGGGIFLRCLNIFPCVYLSQTKIQVRLRMKLRMVIPDNRGVANGGLKYNLQVYIFTSDKIIILVSMGFQYGLFSPFIEFQLF